MEFRQVKFISLKHIYTMLISCLKAFLEDVCHFVECPEVTKKGDLAKVHVYSFMSHKWTRV